LKLQGRLGEAQRAYEGGLSALDELYSILGSCMLAQRDLDSARRHFSAAVCVNADYEEARRALNDVNEAIVAGELLEHTPEDYVEA
jgi:hypothetical protein